MRHHVGLTGEVMLAGRRRAPAAASREDGPWRPVRRVQPLDGLLLLFLPTLAWASVRNESVELAGDERAYQMEVEVAFELE